MYVNHPVPVGAPELVAVVSRPLSSQQQREGQDLVRAISSSFMFIASGHLEAMRAIGQDFVWNSGGNVE